MERSAEKALINWRDHPERMPLLLRGARQVGKSHLVETFARKYFSHLAVINFEKKKDYGKCFETAEPIEIIHKLSSLLGEPIQPGKTLLFLDEIQQCPEAIQALRYFKEELPALHIIAAGSLLEFALQHKEFKMPVGRVQYLYIYPMTFIEYLEANGKKLWKEAIRSASLDAPMADVLHNQLLKEIKTYMAIGGMPAVVNSYLTEGGGELSRQKQITILETYIDDFAKYASSGMQAHMRTVFDQIPSLIATQAKYSKIDPTVQSRFLKQAIQLIEQAGVLYRVSSTAASGVPLSALSNDKRYKVYFLDVGLLVAKSGMAAELVLNDDVLTVNRGELAEQYVCQELIAAQENYQRPHLYFWEREKTGSSAEVDFVLQQSSKIIPIEVKAGTTGRLKSMQTMLQEKHIAFGIRISQLPLSFDKDRRILSVPFYLVSELHRLIKGFSIF